MFKLVVLSALVAIAVAKPSIHHEVVEIAAPVAYAVPAAVSHTYRKDVVQKPAVVAYASAPAYAYSAPVVAAPVVTKTYVAPAAVSHTYRKDVISKPAAVTYVAPAVVQKAVLSSPVAYAAPVAVSHSYRSDVFSKPTVAKTLIATAPAHYEYAAPAHFAYAAYAPVVNAW